MTLGGCGQEKLRRKDVGRESGLEAWSLDSVEMLWVDFSGSGWFCVGWVGSGQTVGVGLSKIVLERLE